MLPPRSQQLVEATPLHHTETGTKACIEFTAYSGGHALMSVSRIEGKPPSRRIVQADSLPLNSVDELREHVLAVIEHVSTSAGQAARLEGGARASNGIREQRANVPGGWTINNLRGELKRFEQELRSAELEESSIRTYVDRSATFLRWLTGDYHPRAHASTVHPGPEFVLQFPLEHARTYANGYAYADDAEVIAIGRAARERGYYTREEFLAVCSWKSMRPGRRQQANTPQAVEDATRVALADSSTESERMSALRSLRGVAWPTASVLLHLAYPERYPILDWRALHALGVDQPRAYSFRFWQAYVSSWLVLVKQSGLDGRTFDRALWQWSKDEPARTE